MNGKSAADIHGPWINPDFDSDLIDRCKRYWTVPANELPDLAVATFLEQRIALPLMIEEAQQRLALSKPDDTEFFDGQLREALKSALPKTNP